MTNSSHTTSSVRPVPTSMGRRAFLTSVGASAGLLLSGGVRGVPAWLGGTPPDELDYLDALRRLDQSLSPAQRAAIVLPWDHPSRQITNTFVIHRGPHLGTLLDHSQISLVRRLYQTMLSPQGRERLHYTTTLEGRLEGSVLAIYSDAAPGELANDGGLGRTQSMLTGGHYMLRQGGREESAYAFGGPISYGQQLGDGVFKVEGNAFKPHGDAANAFYAALEPDLREIAMLPSPPHELMVQIQGEGAGMPLPGLRVGNANGAAREGMRDWLAEIFASYAPDAVSDAFAAIDAHGGIGALHVSFFEEYAFYADGARLLDLSAAERVERGLPYCQVWRIEGPACVLHFQGYPHVHAYINVVRDPARQSVGETLAHSKHGMRPEAVREMMLEVLRRETGETIAHYPLKPLGRIPAGVVTTGSVNSLDPFRDRVVVAEVRAEAMADDLRKSLEAQGVEIEAGRSYRIATIEYMLLAQDQFGVSERSELSGALVSDLVTDYLRGVGHV